jgi:3-phosphoinositide dependent protein kinase-1
MINDGELSPIKRVTFSSENKTDSPINKGKKLSKLSSFSAMMIQQRKSESNLNTLNTSTNSIYNIENSSSSLYLNKYSCSSTSCLQKKNSILDFVQLKLLGRGSYAKCVLSKNKYNGKLYALKINNKSFLKKFDKQHEVMIERYALTHLNHYNIIKLNMTFQDNQHLYFVLEFCENKDLAYLLNLVHKLDFDLAQFFAAELFVAIKYMHSQNIIHRDLKPENIGITEDMHLKIFDFGSAYVKNKYFDKKKMKFVNLEEKVVKEYLSDYSKDEVEIDDYLILNLIAEFVGTAEYVSPEVLLHQYDKINEACDIWAFGCILFHLFEGKSPFKGRTQDITFENIKNLNYKFSDYTPEDAKDLISKILKLNPSERIGFGKEGYLEIEQHKFFKGIDFNKIDEIKPPIEKIINILNNYGYFEQINYGDNIKPLNMSDNHLIKQENSNNPSFNLNDNDSLYEENLKKIRRIQTEKNLDFFKYKGNINQAEKFLIKNENENKGNNNNILYESLLKKKSPWFHYNTRYLKLYENGILEYFEPNSNKVKGTILINEYCKIEKDENKFELFTEQRKFTFKHNEIRIIDEWVEKINGIIFNKLKKKKEN